MRHHLIVIFLILTSSVTLTAIAKQDKHHDHDAHEHGIADMNVAWVEKGLSIEIQSPAYNLLGFEHQPKTKEQRHAVVELVSTLQKPQQIMSMSGATCQVSDAQVDSPFEPEEKHEEHHHHHDQHHDHQEHERDTHTEFSLHYEFVCDVAKESLTLDMQPLFEQFANLNKVRVQWLTAAQQNSSVITKESAQLVLK